MSGGTKGLSRNPLIKSTCSDACHAFKLRLSSSQKNFALLTGLDVKERTVRKLK